MYRCQIKTPTYNGYINCRNKLALARLILMIFPYNTAQVVMRAIKNYGELKFNNGNVIFNVTPVEFDKPDDNERIKKFLKDCDNKH